jgi:hypothetical protein
MSIPLTAYRLQHAAGVSAGKTFTELISTTK